MNPIINQCCEKLFQQRQTMTVEDLRSNLDLIMNQGENQVSKSCFEIVDALKKTRPTLLLDATILNHQLCHFLRHRLIDLLDQWRMESNRLTAEDKKLFQILVDLLVKMIEQVKMNDEDSSFECFKEFFIYQFVFESLSSLVKKIGKNAKIYENEDNLFQCLNRFISVIQWYQCDYEDIRDDPVVLLLMTSITECLSSLTYAELIEKIPLDAERQSSFEEFFLQTCPCYVVWHRGPTQSRVIQRLCLNQMLTSYQKIYELRLPTIEFWECSLMIAVFYMTAILRYVAFHQSTRKYFKNNPKLIDSLLILFKAPSLLLNIQKTSDYNPETNLSDSAISALFYLVADCDFCKLTQENPYFSKEIFLQSRSAKVDRIKLHSFMILARILDEDDIKNLDQTTELVSVFMDYLVKAVQDESHAFQDVPIQDLLFSLKAFIQHDQIKDEIFKQSYLGFLIRIPMEEKFHHQKVLQLSLEIIWALIFDEKLLKLLIHNHETFLSYLKEELIDSKDKCVQAAARGILWHIESLTKSSSKIAEETSEQVEYDLMISYSHTDKDLCFRIHQSLTDLNYRVWLDRENMFGSTLQSMATAIESSKIILVCMSNAYKQSNYCRSEAEYAFTRQRHIIPLVMENKYRPDGWLGFICASKLYVDFTKMEFDVAFQRLLAQIQLHGQGQSTAVFTVNPNSTLTNDHSISHSFDYPTLVNSSNSTFVSRRNPSYNDRYFSQWSHDDLLDFLFDHKFSELLLLVKTEPLFDGLSLEKLYQQTQDNNQSTYQILDAELFRTHNQHLPYLSYLRFLTELHQNLTMKTT